MVPRLENPAAILMFVMVAVISFMVSDDVKMGTFAAMCCLNGFIAGMLAFGKFVHVGKG